MSGQVTFAIISDIHFGTLGYSKEGILAKLGTKAGPLLRNFVRHMNNEVRPSFVIQLGDVIEDKTLREDRKHFRGAMRILGALDCPLYHAVGNHDLRNLAMKEYAHITSCKPYYSFDAGGCRGIVLYSDDREKIGPRISPVQRRWLTRELARCSMPAFVFLHHSLGEQVEGNVWFAHKPHRALVHERRAIRSVLEKSKKVNAVFNGHLHWNNKEVFGGVPYFTVQSLVENFRGNGTPSASYAIVRISSESIKVLIEGNDHALFRHVSR